MTPLHALIAAWASGALILTGLIVYAELDRAIRQRIRRRRRHGTLDLTGHKTL